MVGYSQAPVYLCCICHEREREMHKQAHTHTHACRVAHTLRWGTPTRSFCVCVCCQKGNKNIFAADLILLYFAIFICFFFARVFVCVCVCECGRQDGSKENIGLFAYAIQLALLYILCLFLFLSAHCVRQKPLLYVSLRLPAAYPRRVAVGVRVGAGCVSWPEDAVQVADCCLLPCLAICF